MAELPQKFKKGNQVKKGKTKSLTRKLASQFTKDEIAQNVMSLFTRSISDLEATAQAKDATCWEYIMTKAISKGDTRFIIFLIEQVVGKATQTIENLDNNTKVIELKYNLAATKDAKKPKDGVNGSKKTGGKKSS